MRDLSADIASLESIVDDLVGKLAKITSAGKQGSTTGQPPSGSCDLAVEINAQTIRISDVRMRLLDLSTRIEI
jgi:hypothetical protein